MEGGLAPSGPAAALMPLRDLTSYGPAPEDPSTIELDRGRLGELPQALAG
ncbi:MAG TPA: hypothetical protein VNK24_08770 [Elusimicrobiota bacterium]|nr:hypothetical protein [Elusimicrobiota bacterium]